MYLPAYLDNMARGVTSKDCFSMAKVIPRASFSSTALVAYKVQNITKGDNLGLINTLSCSRGIANVIIIYHVIEDFES